MVKKALAYILFKLVFPSYRNINTSQALVSVDESLPSEGVIVDFDAAQHPVVLPLQRS